MQNKDNSSSDFGKIKASGSESINLSRATRLERSGSTCDAYIVRKEHKTLFVKKLKDELRGHVQVRVAFHKDPLSRQDHTTHITLTRSIYKTIIKNIFRRIMKLIPLCLN